PKIAGPPFKYEYPSLTQRNLGLELVPPAHRELHVGHPLWNRGERQQVENVSAYRPGIACDRIGASRWLEAEKFSREAVKSRRISKGRRSAQAFGQFAGIGQARARAFHRANAEKYVTQGAVSEIAEFRDRFKGAIGAKRQASRSSLRWGSRIRE